MAAIESGVEIIAVIIDGEVCQTYQGLSGTFAGMVYNCVDKKVLPGFFWDGLVRQAEFKDRKLFLSLTGNHSREELLEILDIALLNMVAFPHPGSEAVFFIETRSDK